ncbi:MAG: hypothetical protein AAGA50_26585 [Pseudomonadota bacterium]
MISGNTNGKHRSGRKKVASIASEAVGFVFDLFFSDFWIVIALLCLALVATAVLAGVLLELLIGLSVIVIGGLIFLLVSALA